MKPRLRILLVLCSFSGGLFGQVNHNKAYQATLNRSQVGKVFTFDQSTNFLLNKTWLHDYDSLVLVYLGNIKTKRGGVLKFLTSRWYWNTSHRATTRIVIFNLKNQYMGDYYLASTYDVPDKIKGTSLIFINDKESDCIPNLITRINFRNGIPKKIFLRCQGKFGDIYSFAQNL